MRKLTLGLVALVATPMVVFAAPVLNIDSVAGLYTAAPPNNTTDSGKANNVLEVVKLSPSTAYVRTHLEINDAICGFWGVMRPDGDTLVGRDANNPKCELRLHFSRDKVTFEDQDGLCKEYSCGVNGWFSGEEFSVKSRRPITYMKRLIASRQYREAIQAEATK
jgi:hypothetical protein